MNDADLAAIVAFLRRLGATASNRQAAGAYLHAADAIERGDHLEELLP